MVKIRIGTITNIGLIPDSAEPPHAVKAARYYAGVKRAIKKQQEPGEMQKERDLLRQAFFGPVILDDDELRG